MDLNDDSQYKAIDTHNVLAEIDGLPEHLTQAWKLGKRLVLPLYQNVNKVVIAGMGCSALAAEMLATYAVPHCALPLFVQREDDLPAWVNGQDTLLITVSHPGDTPETLSVFQRGLQRNLQMLTITSAGNLAKTALQANVPAWQYESCSPSRAGTAWTFVLLLAAFARLGLIPDPADELGAAVQAVLAQQARLKADVPVVHNPAKRLAGQLMGRWVTFFAGDFLTPLARHWKEQVNRLAKAYASFEVIPEAAHNALLATLQPERDLSHLMAIFLRSRFYQARNLLRTDIVRRTYMLEGINTDCYDPTGDSPLAHMLTALHFGDFTAYYLAILYDVDPASVEALEQFQAEISSACE